MFKSSLIELLKTFSAHEFRELGEFVHSPIFNKNAKVSSLYDIIKKCFPDLESPNLRKEKVFSKIYPGEEFRDNTIRLLMFYLYETTKQYLQLKWSQKSTVRSSLDLAHSLLERDLLKEAERILKETYKQVESSKFRDEEYFWNKYQVEDLVLYLKEKQYQGRYEKYLTGVSLQNLIKSLTDSYLLRILRNYAVVLNTNEMYKTGYEVRYFKDILKVFDIEYFKDSMTLELYYYACRILDNPADEESFFRMKKLIYEAEDKIDMNSLLDLYINLENYCVRRGREGKKAFDRELFEIYKMEIEKKVYVQANFMTANFYKSVATTAIVVKEYSWAEKFLEEYRQELNPEFRDSAYYHCCAKLEIAKHDLNKALECLSKVRTDEIYLKTETKLLFTVIYYELGIEDSLASLLDTMRHFFKNDRFMSDERNSFYADYVRILNKLNSVKQKKNPDSIADLKSLIESKEKLFLKNWLLEKVSRLE